MVLASSDRWRDPALLDHLGRLRHSWQRLTRRIVGAVLEKHLPPTPAPLLEIGAGGGQLRDWLPRERAAETIHTEPSAAFFAALRAHHRDATVIQAAATSLPVPPGSMAAVLALCVFDTLPDLGAVRDELHRVLRPGGKVIHFLDLATSPDCLFPELIAGGELPLTNFSCDSELLASLDEADRARIPAADEFDDVLAIKWEPFVRFVGLLTEAGHPLVSELGPYAALHRPGALDPEHLADGFMASSADPVRLRALNRALLGLTLTARRLGREWPLRAVSARAHFRSRLCETFSASHGFSLEFAGPVSARELSPHDNSTQQDVRYMLRNGGRVVSRAAMPAGSFGTPVEELENVPEAARRVPEGNELCRETTVEVFVVRRSG
jgi:SAM-dependent methyltransferase